VTSARTPRWPFFVAYGVIVIIATVRALSQQTWDDALFFQRFGFNIVHAGVAAWNVADGPVHGSTSQLFQLVAAVVVAIAPGHYQLAIKLFLGACLWLTFAVCGASVRVAGRSDDDTSLALVFCGFCAPTLLLLVGSGMETELALFTLAVALLVIELARAGRLSARTEPALFVASQVLLYLARPDLLLVTVPAALGLVAWRERPLRLRRALILALATGAALALLLGVLRAYYGAALPLSWFVKNRLLTPYDAAYTRLDLRGTRRQFFTWLMVALPFLFVALSQRPSARVWQLLTAAFALVVYHVLFTLGIMGYHARFLMPALVPVLLAASLAWPRFAAAPGSARRVLVFVVLWPLLAWLGAHFKLIEARKVDDRASWIAASEYALYGVTTALCLLLPLMAAGRRRLLLAVPLLAVLLCASRRLHWPSPLDDASIETQTAKRDWPGLYPVKACVPEPTHIYHSELGLPGVMFLRSRITDLSGLMNPDIAYGRSDFDAMCLRDPPQILFLPHRTHQKLNERIKNSRCLRQFQSVDRLRASSTPLYVRRDLYDDFERCARALE
jgi:hypothetical protein